MGDIYINTSLFPYRLSLSQDRKAAMDLTIELKNQGDSEKMVSMDLILPETFGADKTGMMRQFSKKLDSLKAGTSASIVIPLYLSGRARQGEYTASLKISEYFNNYNYLTKTYSKKLILRVVD
ncbi:MAG: hypothetical protein V1672_05885 [Candidatus Diapherotrites archaeon]